MAFARAYELAGENGWAMWADIDDILPEDQVDPHLKALAECPRDCDWILTDYAIPEQRKRSPRERFFRYKTGWWWRPVHENMHPTKTIKIWSRRDLESARHMPPLGRRPSNERNTRILEFNDSFTPNIKFYLHYEKMIQGKAAEAIRYGAEALALKALDGVHRYETLLNMSNMTDRETALRFAVGAEKADPNRREALALQASILMDSGKAEEALATIDRMEKIPVPSFPQWTHRDEYYGWKAKQLRAWALRLTGDKERALQVESSILLNGGTPRISLLHATRGRPLQAVQMMNLWISRAKRPERIEHIFAVDIDDASAANLQRFACVMQDNPDGHSVGAWNLAARHCTGDILIQFSDDWECPTGWDEMLESRLDLQQSQALRISDGRRTDELIPMAIITRKFYEQHGLFNEQFKNQYSDAEFTIRAQKAQAIIDAKDIVFAHHHPMYEPAMQADETHRRVNNAIETERAKSIFEKLTT
jgi:hypothetical protein